MSSHPQRSIVRVLRIGFLIGFTALADGASAAVLLQQDDRSVSSTSSGKTTPGTPFGLGPSPDRRAR